jgi:hypothetical protein
MDKENLRIQQAMSILATLKTEKIMDAGHLSDMTKEAI